MRLFFGIVGAACILGFAPLSALAQEQSDDTIANSSSLSDIDDVTVDFRFQCPETLSSGDTRLDENARYYAWARARHPDWNFRKRVDVRYGLLRRHTCAVTLANITASAGPAFPAAPAPVAPAAAVPVVHQP